MAKFTFGTFDYLCAQVPLPFCSALRLQDPECYSRNLSIGNWFVFAPGTFLSTKTLRLKKTVYLGVIFVYFISIIITAMMIYYVKNKYTAVGKFWKKIISIRIVVLVIGRKEIVYFLYLFLWDSFFGLLLVSNVISTSSSMYPVGHILNFSR